MSDQHWLPLWCGDFLTDTSTLSDAETGQYLLLLMCMWRNDGELPDDPVKLARVARCKRVSPDVMAFFKRDNGVITQKRLTSELARTRKIQAKRKAAADARWGDKPLKNNDVGDANGYAHDMQPHHTTVSNSVQVDSKRSQGSRMPSDWQPTEADYKWATKEGFNDEAFLKAQTAAMRDWAEANAHREVGRKASWSAAWKGWIRREWSKHNPAKGVRKNGNGYYIKPESEEFEAWKRHAMKINDYALQGKLRYASGEVLVPTRWPQFK